MIIRFLFALLISAFAVSVVIGSELTKGDLDEMLGENRPTPDVDFTFSIFDNPENRFFEIVLESRADDNLCFRVEVWPNTGLNGSLGPIGAMHFASESVYIEQGDRTFPIEQTHTGTCRGKNFKDTELCHVRIQPGGKISAIIPYERFEPGFVESAPKNLMYFPSVPGIHPYYCDFRSNFSPNQWKDLMEYFEYQFDPDHPGREN